METMASQLSYSPFKSCSVLLILSSFSSFVISISISERIFSSSSLIARLNRSFNSETLFDQFKNFSFLFFSKLNSLLFFAASCGLFHVSGLASSSSRFFISKSILFKSKQPPYGLPGVV